MESYSPPLTIHVFWSREGDQSLHHEVARALYGFLCRPPDGNPVVNPGPGIPVRTGFHALQVAVAATQAAQASGSDGPCLVAVPLLDNSARVDVAFCDSIEELWRVGGAQGRARVLVLPVLLDSTWTVPDHIAPCRAAARAPEAEKADCAVEEVSTAICHFLMNRKGGEPRRVKIFVSHAKHDLPETQQLAVRLRDYINGTELKSFFDTNDVRRGEGLGEQLDRAQQNAVCLSLRTDAYSESPYCLDEVLTAKRHGVPIVCVHALCDTERRSLAYGGNSFTYVSREGENELRTITSLCLQAWLRHLHFHHAAPGIFGLHSLPLEPRCISRPPELIDFAQSLLPREAATLVLYPDPPLPQVEVAVLRSAYPKVRLATPATLHRELLRRVAAPPLDGWRIALSLSDSPEIPAFSSFARGQAKEEPRGLTDKHVQDTVMHLTASLISAGAELGYGGNLSAEGFTVLLSDLIAARRRTTKTSRNLLFNYVAAYLWNAEDSKRISARFARIDVEGTGQLQPEVRAALELTSMRRRMAEECHARIILGGKTFKYSGRFPGQAEEAWAHLSAKKPVYVIGGFGGCAALVAHSLNGDLSGLPTEVSMQEGSDRYRGFCEGFDSEALRLKMDLPPGLDELWTFFAECGRGFFHQEGAAENKIWSNGLTVAENRRLFASVHPEEITALILRGLLQVRDRHREEGETPLKVMLFQGSITDVPDVDSYAVPVLLGAPLRGADGALDAVMDGAIGRHLEKNSPKVTLPVISSRLPGDYVILQTVGDLAETDLAERQTEKDWLLERIVSGMRDLVGHARSLGLESPALVPFGSNLRLSVRESVLSMLRGLLEAGAGSHLHSVALCELDPERYQELLAIKKEIESSDPKEWGSDFAGRVQFSELRSQGGLLASSSRSPTAILLDVRRQGDSLIVHARAPGDGTAIPLEERVVDWAQVMRLTHGFGNGKPPDVNLQPHIGEMLADAVLPPHARDVLAANPRTPIDILHDIEAAAIPFELLSFGIPSRMEPCRPALDGGIRRCLLTRNIPRRRITRTRDLRLRILLVADPNDNLREARKEAEEISKVFAGRSDILIERLTGEKEATREAVLSKIKTQSFDILHFAGHAQFNAREPAKSGILLAGNALLSAQDIHAVELDQLPALVVLNACEAGRLRSQAPEPPTGQEATRDGCLAEALISAGIGGFIGNLWRVDDEAAALFSTELYQGLSGGRNLGDAFLAARRRLSAENMRDWPNHMLFGQPNLRI